MSDIVERLRTMADGFCDPVFASAWVEAADEIERLRGMVHDDAVMLGARGYEIERLTAYANHERSLGAEGPMIELTQAKQEIERLKAALHLAEKALTLRGPGWPLDEVRAALEERI